MNLFTYIQHLETAVVLCRCVLTYSFSNYYNIHKEGRTQVRLKSSGSAASTAGSHGCRPLPRRHSSPGDDDKCPSL